MKKIILFILFLSLLYFLSPVGGTIFYLLEIRWVYVLLISFLFAIVLTPVAIKLGKRFNIMDYPDSRRKIHKFPVPVTGGIVIFVGFFLTLIRNMNFNPQMVGVLLGSLIIFTAGIIDDKWKLSAEIKLIIQLSATVVLILFGVRVQIVPHGIPFKEVIDILITLIGVIGIMNAFNYMDGMDGEASGLAIISALTLFIIALQGGDRHTVWMAVAVAGSCLGFLGYNFPRAKVFLGDNGSTLLGFLLASIAISGSWRAINPVVAFMTAFFIFSIYIFDMIYTTVSRIKNKTVKNLREWISVTGKDHLHHRLVNLGFNKSQSVIIIWACAVIFSFSAIVIRKADYIIIVLISVQVILIYCLIVILMLVGRKIEYGESSE